LNKLAVSEIASVAYLPFAGFSIKQAPIKLEKAPLTKFRITQIFGSIGKNTLTNFPQEGEY